MDDTLDFSKLQHKVFQHLVSVLSNKRLLVAVSGGLDSIFLLELLISLQKRLDFQIVVAHVFHGASDYRRQAFDFVRNYTKLTFVSNVKNAQTNSDTDDLGEKFPNNSEESLRKFRQKTLLHLMQITESDFIVMGHHRNDLLETRMIRLIRGVGREGLTAMSVRSGKVLRPLLLFWRQDLVRLAETKAFRFLEDPSNTDLKYLRNWLRHQWLADLENYRKGATRALSRSLDQLANISRQELKKLKGLIDVEGVSRSGLLALTNVEQRQILASYLNGQNVKNYSASHVDEVLKRLKSSKNNFDFRVGGRVWKITSTRVRVEDLV